MGRFFLYRMHPLSIAELNRTEISAQAVGAPVPEAVQGRSLMRLIRGEEDDPRVAISESPYYGRRIAASGAEQRMIVSVESQQHELYSYRSDPLELDDLAGEHPPTETALQGEIRRWMRQVEANQYPRQRLIDVDKAHRDQLRALGYVP
jgi:hypothetical protein